MNYGKINNLVLISINSKYIKNFCLNHLPKRLNITSIINGNTFLYYIEEFIDK